MITKAELGFFTSKCSGSEMYSCRLSKHWFRVRLKGMGHMAWLPRASSAGCFFRRTLGTIGQGGCKGGSVAPWRRGLESVLEGMIPESKSSDRNIRMSWRTWVQIMRATELPEHTSGGGQYMWWSLNDLDTICSFKPVSHLCTYCNAFNTGMCSYTWNTRHSYPVGCNWCQLVLSLTSLKIRPEAWCPNTHCQALFPSCEALIHHLNSHDSCWQPQDSLDLQGDQAMSSGKPPGGGECYWMAQYHPWSGFVYSCSENVFEKMNKAPYMAEWEINMHYPFKSHVEWSLARFLVENFMQSQINKFLSLPWVSHLLILSVSSFFINFTSLMRTQVQAFVQQKSCYTGSTHFHLGQSGRAWFWRLKGTKQWTLSCSFGMMGWRLQSHSLGTWSSVPICISTHSTLMVLQVTSMVSGFQQSKPTKFR